MTSGAVGEVRAFATAVALDKALAGDSGHEMLESPLAMVVSKRAALGHGHSRSGPTDRSQQRQTL